MSTIQTRLSALRIPSTVDLHLLSIPQGYCLQSVHARLEPQLCRTSRSRSKSPTSSHTHRMAIRHSYPYPQLHLRLPSRHPVLSPRKRNRFSPRVIFVAVLGDLAVLALGNLELFYLPTSRPSRLLPITVTTITTLDLRLAFQNLALPIWSSAQAKHPLRAVPSLSHVAASGDGRNGELHRLLYSSPTSPM